MKKIIALVVAILMIASMSVVVFAENEGDSVATDAALDTVGSGTELTYTVAKGYVITIPADISFNTALNADREVTVTDTKLPGDEQLVVSVASQNGWKLVDTDSSDGQSDDVVYSAYYGKTESSNGTKLTANAGVATEILSVNMYTDLDSVASGASGEVAMYFETLGTAQVGTFTDLLTFSTALADYDNTPAQG